MRRLAAVAALALIVGGCASDSTATDDLAAAIAAAAPGDRIVVAAGTHRGPIVIDKPLTIIARPGAVLRSGPDEPALLIAGTSGVVIEGLAVEGGSSGIEVNLSEGVELRGVSITESWWHGIFVDNSRAEITDCTVSRLAGPYPQGIEVVNSDGRQPTTITGCTITGPMLEGIASHVSRVVLSGNTVTNTMERGIAIAEMSAGTVSGNTVEGAVGSAFYCGDRSWCRFEDNSASDVVAADDGFRSTGGHALVVTLQATAYVEAFATQNVAGLTVLLFPDSFLNPIP